MDIEFDEKKDQANREERGFGLAEFKKIDWSSTLTTIDNRHDYGETRCITIGMIGQRLHVAVWCYRGEKQRIISLRKANTKEQDEYDQKIQNHE